MSPPASLIPEEAYRLLDNLYESLPLVLRSPQPVFVDVGGIPVLAVAQDVVDPPDILLQAMTLANIPFSPLGSSPSSLSSASPASSSSEEEDTWVLAADNILRWLDQHDDAPHSEDDSDASEPSDDDSRRPPLKPLQWQPVRPSAPPPRVDWDRTSRTFGFYPPADFTALRIPCARRSVFNNRPPLPEQLPVLRTAVASMLASGLISQTKRGPFLSPVQLAPKSSTESRFILDASHLTPHLPAPRFRLDPLPRVLLQNPLPPDTFFTKVDLAEAFYHITLHPSARLLTTFRLDGTYYSFNRLPFGIRTAPFWMQQLATSFARHLRAQGVWAWAYVDNFLLAHPDPSFLSAVTSRFYADLLQCGFAVNAKDTSLAPSQTIRFLGFALNGLRATIGHTPQRVRTLSDTLHVLLEPQTLRTYQQLAGHWAFYFSLYNAGYSSLTPLFRSALTGTPPPPAWVFSFSNLWQTLPHLLPLRPLQPANTVYADASASGLGVVLPAGTLAIITLPSRDIYLREALAWALAALLAPPRTLIYTDNLALRHGLTRGHLRALPWPLSLALSFLVIKKHLRAKWLPTGDNPADMPSRLPHTIPPIHTL